MERAVRIIAFVAACTLTCMSSTRGTHLYKMIHTSYWPFTDPAIEIHPVSNIIQCARLCSSNSACKSFMTDCTIERETKKTECHLSSETSLNETMVYTGGHFCCGKTVNTTPTSPATPTPTVTSTQTVTFGTPPETTSLSSTPTTPPETTTMASTSTTPPETTTMASTSTPPPTTSTMASTSTPPPTTSTMASTSTPTPTTSTITSTSTPPPTITTLASTSTPPPTITTMASTSTPAPTITTMASTSTPPPTTTTITSTSTPPPTITTLASTSTPPPTITTLASTSTPPPTITTLASTSTTPPETTTMASTSTTSPSTTTASTNESASPSIIDIVWGIWTLCNGSMGNFLAFTDAGIFVYDISLVTSPCLGPQSLSSMFTESKAPPNLTDIRAVIMNKKMEMYTNDSVYLWYDLDDRGFRYDKKRTIASYLDTTDNPLFVWGCGTEIDTKLDHMFYQGDGYYRFVINRDVHFVCNRTDVVIDANGVHRNPLMAIPSDTIAITALNISTFILVTSNQDVFQYTVDYLPVTYALLNTSLTPLGKMVFN